MITTEPPGLLGPQVIPDSHSPKQAHITKTLSTGANSHKRNLGGLYLGFKVMLQSDTSQQGESLSCLHHSKSRNNQEMIEYFLKTPKVVKYLPNPEHVSYCYVGCIS